MKNEEILFRELLIQMTKLNKNITQLIEEHQKDRGDYPKRFSPSVSGFTLEEREATERYLNWKRSEPKMPGADL